jgi:hypothetical protein
MFRRPGGPSVTPEGSSRRQFIKRAGVTGALTAAVIGGAEVAGLGSAFASTKHANHRAGSPKICECACSYKYTPGQCGKCGTGQCCFTYTCTGTCGGKGKLCITRNCANFNVCV